MLLVAGLWIAIGAVVAVRWLAGGRRERETMNAHHRALAGLARAATVGGGAPPATRLMPAPTRPVSPAIDPPTSPPGRGRVRVAGAGIAVAAAVFAVIAVVSRPDGEPVASTPRAAARPQPRPAASSTVPAPTSAPAPSALAPTETTASGAAYVVPSSPVAAVLATSAPCWIQVRIGGSSGRVVAEGVVGPGEQRSFEDAAGLWIRVGYPAGASLRANGAAVPLPARRAPFNVALRAAS